MRHHRRRGGGRRGQGVGTEVPVGRRRPFHPRQRGDASLLIIFLTLAAVLLGATSLTLLALGNLGRARDIVASSQALYAADTGVERGLYDYFWSTPQAPTCTAGDTVLPTTPAVAYRLAVRADDGSCPSLLAVQTGTRALCIESRGIARNGAVQRRVASDTVASGTALACPR